ncbi:MAG: hypothetical protein U0470_05590 [Anaerolineae bacterium]
MGPADADPASLAMNLMAPPDWSGAALARAAEIGADALIAAIEAAGLQGRGGAGFPSTSSGRAWPGSRRRSATWC